MRRTTGIDTSFEGKIASDNNIGSSFYFLYHEIYTLRSLSHALKKLPASARIEPAVTHTHKSQRKNNWGGGSGELEVIMRRTEPSPIGAAWITHTHAQKHMQIRFIYKIKHTTVNLFLKPLIMRMSYPSAVPSKIIYDYTKIEMAPLLSRYYSASL